MRTRWSRRVVRRRVGMCVAITLAAVTTLSIRAATAAEEVRGEAKIISGNEVRVGKRDLRLFGIVAPGLDDLCELGEAKIRCGIVAWAELIKLADGRYISCDVETKDTRAIFATCYLSETDLNEALVRSGWAKAVPEQTDRYVVDETDAKESQRGLWSDHKPQRQTRGGKNSKR